MKNVDRLKLIIREDEGLRLKPYECTEGRLTIGIGRNLSDVGIGIEEARYLFNNDINRSTTNAKLNYSNFGELSENRQIVIISMYFVLGAGGANKFKNFKRAVLDKDYHKAADELVDSLWVVQARKRVTRLSEMMRNG